MNPNRQIRIEKITLNMGAGKDQRKLEKGVALLKNISGVQPIKSLTMKRIASWGLRPRLPIGCKVTLRGKAAADILKKLLGAKENKLSSKQVDTQGNLSFGIHEYIDIPGAQYDPEIGIMGFEVSVTFERPGYRIKKRRMQQKKVPARHKVTKEEVTEFMKTTFSVSFDEEEN